MSGYTQEEIQEFYDTAKRAYLSAVEFQSQNVNDKGYTNQKIKDLKEQMDQWKELLDAAQGGNNGLSVVQVVSKHG